MVLRPPLLGGEGGGGDAGGAGGGPPPKIASKLAKSTGMAGGLETGVGTWGGGAGMAPMAGGGPKGFGGRGLGAAAPLPPKIASKLARSGGRAPGGGGAGTAPSAGGGPRGAGVGAGAALAGGDAGAGDPKIASKDSLSDSPSDADVLSSTLGSPPGLGDSAAWAGTPPKMASKLDLSSSLSGALAASVLKERGGGAGTAPMAGGGPKGFGGNAA